MIFGIIRWGIGITLFVIIFFVLKSKKRHINHGRKRIIISAVFAVLITTVIFFIPFENLFVHFKTPESAYCYFQTGTPKYTVYGKNSAMIIADDRESENISVISKADKVGSWKISLGYNTKIVSQSFDGGNSALVFKHKPTGDCLYLCILMICSHPLKMNRELNLLKYLMRVRQSKNMLRISQILKRIIQ